MIKKSLIYLSIAMIGIFFQSAVLRNLIPWLVVPDIILLLVVCLAVRNGAIPGLVGAFFLGLLSDLASGQFLGPNAAGCVVAYLGVVYVADKVYVERGFAIGVLAFAGCLIKVFTFLALLGIYMDIEILGWSPISRALVEAFLTALFSPLVFWLTSLGPKRSQKRSISGQRLSWES